MAAISLVSVVTGRPRAAAPALAATVAGPRSRGSRPLARDAGFAMSVLATAALLALAPRWAEALRRRRVPAVVAAPLAVAAAAHVVTAPVIAAFSGRVSVVAVPANVLAEPVVAPATVLGFVTAVVAVPSARLAAWLAQVAGWPCRWLVIGRRPASVVCTGRRCRGRRALLGGLLLLAVAGASVGAGDAARRSASGARRGSAVVALVMLMPVRAAVSGWPPAGWVFVACDVGQGDGLVLPRRRGRRRGRRHRPGPGADGPVPARPPRRRGPAARPEPLPPGPRRRDRRRAPRPVASARS